MLYQEDRSLDKPRSAFDSSLLKSNPTKIETPTKIKELAITIIELKLKARSSKFSGF